MHNLRNSIVEAPLDIIVIIETCGNNELKEAELSVLGYTLFRNGRSDGRPDGGDQMATR